MAMIYKNRRLFEITPQSLEAHPLSRLQVCDSLF